MVVPWFTGNVLAKTIVVWVIVAAAAFFFIPDKIVATILVAAFVLGSLPRLVRSRRQR